MQETTALQPVLAVRGQAPSEVTQCTAHQRAMDDIHRGIVELVASRHLIPVVATGNVLMHVRSRKPLQDTMTAIRIGKPVAECGYELAPNAEQHLRSRLRLANLYPEHVLAETLNVLERCDFSLDELKYEYPDEAIAGFGNAQDALTHLDPNAPNRSFVQMKLDDIAAPAPAAEKQGS